MTRRKGLQCAKCHKPFRKGQHVQVVLFARYAGLAEDGRPGIKPWLAIHSCMGHEPDEIRALLAQGEGS